MLAEDCNPDPAERILVLTVLLASQETPGISAIDALAVIGEETLLAGGIPPHLNECDAAEQSEAIRRSLLARMEQQGWITVDGDMLRPGRRFPVRV